MRHRAADRREVGFRYVTTCNKLGASHTAVLVVGGAAPGLQGDLGDHSRWASLTGWTAAEVVALYLLPGFRA